MSRDSLQTGLDLLRLNTTASMEPPGDIKAQIQASMVDVYCVNVHFLFLQLPGEDGTCSCFATTASLGVHQTNAGEC